MRPTTGTCPRCKTTQPLSSRGNIDRHDVRSWHGNWTDGPEFRQCPGTSAKSVEFTDAARATRDRRLLARVVAARDYATVALDAVLSKQNGTLPDDEHEILLLELPKLLRLAAALGRLTHPPAKATTAGIKRSSRYWSEPWLAKKRQPKFRKSHVDIYCVFCGELIIAQVDEGVPRFLRGLATTNHANRIELGDKVYAHTTPCALQSLAGLRVPVTPGTRRLPTEFREDRA